MYTLYCSMLRDRNVATKVDSPITWFNIQFVAVKPFVLPVIYTQQFRGGASARHHRQWSTVLS